MQKRYVVVIEMFNTCIAFVDWFYAPDMGGHFWAFVFFDVGVRIVVFPIEPRKGGAAEIFRKPIRIRKKS